MTTGTNIPCRKCGESLSQARLDAMPGTTICVPCLESMGDSPMPQGTMVWNHKTAPVIMVLKTPEALEIARKEDRHGFNARK